MPYFLSSCMPQGEQLKNCNNSTIGLVYIEQFNCENYSRNVYRSFFSSEIAQASFTVLFLIFYIQKHFATMILRAFVQFILGTFLFWYSLKQYLNNNSHFEDIFVGNIVGSTFSVITFQKMIQLSSSHDDVKSEIVYTSLHQAEDERDTFMMSEPITATSINETNKLIARSKSFSRYNSI